MPVPGSAGAGGDSGSPHSASQHWLHCWRVGAASASAGAELSLDRAPAVYRPDEQPRLHFTPRKPR